MQLTFIAANLSALNKFKHQLSSWKSQFTSEAVVDWTVQLRILNEITELITPAHSLEEIISLIYDNVNQVLDAYQFCVGIYDEEQGMIQYKGMMEGSKRLPDFSVDALDNGRLAAWCIRNEQDIFINDFDKEYINYVSVKPAPLSGIQPQAALYTPLKLNNKVVGLVVARTMNKHVFQPHHLQLLKTVGNFVVRALELSKISAIPSVQMEGSKKQWRWNNKGSIDNTSGRNFTKLTEREKEVLLLLVSGIPNKLIAEKLFVSPGTIKTHTLNIYSKLEVANRSSAILKAVEYGWVI